MPGNNDNDKGAGNGEGGSGAGAGAGGDQGGSGDGKGQGQGSGQGGGEETVTIKKSELEQIKTDRDNYKAIGLKKKADERNLDGGAGSGQGGDRGNSTVIDEKKVDEVATAAVNKTLRAASEKTAKRAFLQAHPEYADDAQWTTMMSHLTFRGSELTHDEVMDRMEAAVLEHKRSTGKLEEYLKSEHERGMREGRIQGEFGSGRGTGGAGDKNESGKGSGTLSPEGERMARSLHNDPAKVAKVDPSKDNVINVV